MDRDFNVCSCCCYRKSFSVRTFVWLSVAYLLLLLAKMIISYNFRSDADLGFFCLLTLKGTLLSRPSKTWDLKKNLQMRQNVYFTSKLLSKLVLAEMYRSDARLFNCSQHKYNCGMARKNSKKNKWNLTIWLNWFSLMRHLTSNKLNLSGEKKKGCGVGR